MFAQDVIILEEKERKEMEEQVEKVMAYASTVSFYDQSNPIAVRRGFMAELVCRRLLGIPLVLGVGPGEYTRGYDIRLKKGDKRVCIDVKSGLVKSSWSPYTQQKHDLKLHRFKRNLPDDFLYVFISGTDDPFKWIIEGCCTQKEVWKAIDKNTNAKDALGMFDENTPYLVNKGEYHRKYMMDHDTVIVPNMWLPYKGSTGVFRKLNDLFKENKR